MISLIPLFFYTLSWIYYSKYQFIERDSSDKAIKSSASKMWHIWKGVNQASFLSLIFFYTDYKTGILATVSYWISFDIGVNLIALKRPWNYYGTTSLIDKTLGKWMVWIKLVLLIFSVSILIF